MGINRVDRELNILPGGHRFRDSAESSGHDGALTTVQVIVVGAYPSAQRIFLKEPIVVSAANFGITEVAVDQPVKKRRRTKAPFVSCAV